MAELARVSGAWAQALSGMEGLPQDKLDVLLQVCSAPDSSSKAPSSAADSVARLLPLALFLESSGSKAAEAADKVVPQLVAGLEAVPEVWLAVQHSPLQAQHDITSLLVALRSVLLQPWLPLAAKQRLAFVLCGVFEQLVETAHAHQQRQNASNVSQVQWHSCGCNLWLRAVTRSQEFEQSPLLPLLPADAARVLQRLMEKLSSSGGESSGSSSGSSSRVPLHVGANGAEANGNSSPSAFAAGPAQDVVAHDDKLYLLALKLVATADGAHASAANSGAKVGSLDAGLLQSLLAWSTARLKAAVGQLLELRGSSTATPLPPANVTRAAICLASTCISALLEGPDGVAGAPTAELRQAIGELLELVLSVAEALLAAAQRAPRALASDRLLLMAAAMLPHCAAFAAALDPGRSTATSHSPSQGELARRLRAVMLGSARLVTVVTPAARTDTSIARASTPTPAPPAAAAAGTGSFQNGSHEEAARSGAPAPSGSSMFVMRRTSTGMAAVSCSDDISAAVARLQGMSAGSAALDGTAGGATGPGLIMDGSRPWAWDIMQPLVPLSGNSGDEVAAAADTSTGAEAHGLGAVLLCRAAVEVLCQTLARAWHAGECSPVHSFMVLPQALGSQQEQMASALALARLWVVAKGDGQLGRLLLPLLADGLSGGGRLEVGADLAAVLAAALSGMAAFGAVLGSADGDWVYEQALELLLKLYRAPTPASLQLLCGRAAPHHTSGTLAKALTSLTTAATAAPRTLRTGLRLKLLALFNEIGLAVGSEAGGGLGPADLAELLPAVAAACGGLQPHLLRLLSHSSSAMAVAEINAAQRSDASVNRLFVSLWLHTALHRLAAPAGPATGRAQGSAGARAVARWRAAAGRLAGVTPLLLLGPHCSQESDLVQALKVELGGQLAKCRRACDGMLHHLTATVNHTSPLPTTTEPALTAYLYAVANAELCRAALAPLPAISATNSSADAEDEDDGDGSECPLAVTLGYLQGVLPEGVALEWLAAIAESAFGRYLARLKALQARQQGSFARTSQLAAAGAASEGEELDAGPGIQPALVYAEQLACVLIRHLNGRPGERVSGGEEASLLAALSEKLLRRLLGDFPGLTLSRAAYGALLTELQREEGDEQLGQVHLVRSDSGGGTAWRTLSSWVAAAAAVAPSATEALLHEFMLGAAGRASSSSSSEVVHSSTLTGAGAAAAAPAAGVAAGGRGLGQLSANAAALRRGVDLLRICHTARRSSDIGSLEAAHEGTLSLTRKLYYAGLVDGLTRAAGQQEELDQQGSASSSGRGSSPVDQQANGDVSNGGMLALGGQSLSARRSARATIAERIASRLERALTGNVRRSELNDAHLMATALLAARAWEEEAGGPVLGELGERLLKSLAAVPLHSMSPGSMELVGASWAWVAAASPALLVPLVEKLVGSWMWSADQKLGLFAVHADVPRGLDGDKEQHEQQAEQGWHDEGMLKAIGAHHSWLAHLLELWQVASRLGDERAEAVGALYRRLLHHSLRDPALLSMHPAAGGARFRLLQLATMFAHTMHARSRQRATPQHPSTPLSSRPRSSKDGRASSGSTSTSSSTDTSTALLFNKILRAGLLWFAEPPRYFAKCTRREAREQHTAIAQFMAQLDAVGPNAWPSAFQDSSGGSSRESGGADAFAPVHPVWGVARPAVTGYVKLLRFLCSEEVARQRVWVDPLKYADHNAGIAQVSWKEYVQLAWQVHPQLALSLADHFPSAPAIKAALAPLVASHATEPRVQALPSAALLLATPANAAANSALLAALAVWAPGGAEQGLRLLAGPEGKHAAIRAYAMRCLFAEAPERVAFFLPQLVQLLRGDTDGQVRAFFAASATRSDLFAHRLLWALSSEQRPPEEAFNPSVKRSGWQPPKDTGLWTVAAMTHQRVHDVLGPSQKEYWEAENGYFGRVTGLSGMLYKVPKDERRAKLQEALAEFGPPRADLYVPTNPSCAVVNHIPSSGACMQSAAKVPILVAFNCEERAHADAPPLPRKVACIFKVGDDIRQDVLAIQVISMLNDANRRAGLDLYLRPYGCLPTGYECGIIEVVPHTRSRAALGELSDRGLTDIFTHEFGAPGSPAFERARHNFIVSEAAYAVASFLLQAKDRHNGNIMIDSEGHIVHIDFGFILEISPGGNLNFEAAAFKLSHEMAQLIDPGGSRNSAPFLLFQELVVRAYLAARSVAEPIIAAVALMADSGLPCFGRGAPVANLRKRFHLEMSDAQAAAWMLAAVADAYDNWRTVGYDYIQALQNKIPY